MTYYFTKEFDLQIFLWKEIIKGDYQLPEKVLSQQWESLMNKKTKNKYLEDLRAKKEDMNLTIFFATTGETCYKNVKDSIFVL